MIWRISKRAFSLSKKRHTWHRHLKNRAVSFCPMYHFAPVSPIPGELSLSVFRVRLCLAVLSVPCSPVVTYSERADLLALLCVMFSCDFITFQYGVLGQVWYFFCIDS